MKLNYKKVLFTIFVFIIFFTNVNASAYTYFLAADFCKIDTVAKILKIVFLLLNIIRIAVPIMLIISSMIKLTRAVTGGADSLQKVSKTLITNFIAAVLIFLIPTFINIITKLTGTFESYNACLENIKNPITIDPSKGGPVNEEGSANKAAPKIKSVKHLGSFVTISADKGTGGNITGYYFSKTNKKPTGKEYEWILKKSNYIEIAKLPGTYYVYAKDGNNNISAPTKLTITWEDLYNNGPRSRDDKNYPAIVGNLSEVLKTKGDSLQNLNDFIAWSVRSAGLFTNEGVATAGIAAQNYLHAKYNLHISYISNVHCFGQRYNTHFGADPEWGKVITLGCIDSASRPIAQEQGIKRYCMGYYGGQDCQSFFGWAVHNGGFKAENTHGSYVGKNGSKEESCGTNCSKNQMIELHKKLVIGDELVNPHHVMLFLAHYDENGDGIHDGVYIYESYTRVGMKKWSNAELHREGYYTINRMAGYYANQSNYACLQDYKGDMVSIPNAWKDKASLFRSNCKATD